MGSEPTPLATPEWQWWLSIRLQAQGVGACDMMCSVVVRHGWIDIDGIDGAGKSSIVRLLAQRHAHWVVVPEFSMTPLGSFLEGQVRTNPHFIAESELSQSLLFLAEYVDRVHSIVTPSLAEGRTVLFDRGHRSKYVYQALVLQRRYPAITVTSMMDAIFAVLPRPSVAVLLTASIDAIGDRLQRAGRVFDHDAAAFLEAAGDMLQKLPMPNTATLTVDTSELTEGAAADVIDDFVRSQFEPVVSQQ